MKIKGVMNTSISRQVVLTRLESLNRREFLKSTMAGAAGTAFLCWSRSIEAAGLPLRGLEDRVISLSGEWAFELDPQKAGVTEGWFNRSFADSIQLPSTLDERGKGPLNEEREIRKLTRVRKYTGPAWFQREIDIPKDWSGRSVLLAIERTKTASVWVDDRFIGKQDSLTVEHTFDLGKTLEPGRHRLTVCVDNSERPPVGDPHQLSDETQTNWNGLLGRIELRARDAEWIESIRTFPDVAGKRVRVVIELGRESEAHDNSGGKVRLSAKLWNVEKAEDADVAGIERGYGPSAGTLECTLPLGAGAKTWDEFSPALYRLRVELDKEVNGKRITDLREIDFGLREFVRKGTQFSVNGRTIFLRGKHDACVFPLTGYAPMSVDEWVGVLRIAKSYGINHYRFHSWCPPAAAFAAADIVGIYMQPELPNWQAFGEPPKNADGDVEIRNSSSPGARHADYLLAEGKRILQAFANHPSFVMFALGNELAGSRAAMRAVVSEYKRFDPRPLYAQGSNNFFWEPSLAEGDDYWTTYMTGGHYKSGVFFPDTQARAVRGSFAVHTVGHINNRLPGTDFDYAEALKGIPVPVIGHETGQYQVFPNFREIGKYKGVLKARNFEIYKDRLEKAGMLEQADQFVRASGALAVICYREDIEAALRTPGFAGFQLLDLQDFPGQGTALVGILDAFMDSKGLIKPEQWREFCGPTVPLLRMPRYAWLQGERFRSPVELAHYGPDALKSVRLAWKVTGDNGKVLERGVLQPKDVTQGSLTNLGNIEFDTTRFPAPAALTLTVELDGGAARNSYRFWVYPGEISFRPPTGVVVSRVFSPFVQKALAEGRKVLILPTEKALLRSVPGAFQTDFWCYPMFKKYDPPGTLGILCDPAHPALTSFPTRFHSDWQWWPIVRHGRAMIIDDTPASFRPVVQVIDNVERNHKLALAFEAKVGAGRLFVCSGALLENPERAESRQLLHSILRYVESEHFNPKQSLELETLKKIFRTEFA